MLCRIKKWWDGFEPPEPEWADESLPREERLKINTLVCDEHNALRRKPGRDSVKELMYTIGTAIMFGPGGALLYLVHCLHGILTRSHRTFIPTPGAHAGFITLSIGITIGIYLTLLVGFSVWLI